MCGEPRILRRGGCALPLGGGIGSADTDRAGAALGAGERAADADGGSRSVLRRSPVVSSGMLLVGGVVRMRSWVGVGLRGGDLVPLRRRPVEYRRSVAGAGGCGVADGQGVDSWPSCGTGVAGSKGTVGVSTGDEDRG